MTIRITGLNSGLDTDSIIKELVSAYRSKGDKIKKQQTKLSWTQDKWKSLNAKVLNLYKSLDSLRFSTGYNMKKTTVSDTTKATVTAREDAINGTQTLKVDKIAKAGYLTGGQLKGMKSSNKLSDLGFTGDEGTYRISGNGVTKDIKIGKDTKISDFINDLNKSGTGVQATYDETNQRIFISSKSMGKDADFTLTALDDQGQQALKMLGVSVKSDTSSAEAAAWMQYYDANPAVMEANLKDYAQKLVNAKENQKTATGKIEGLQMQNAKLTGAIAYVNAVESIDTVNALKDNTGANITEKDAKALSQLAGMSEANRAKNYIQEDDGTLREATSEDTDPSKYVTYDDLATKYGIKGNETEDKLENGNPVPDGKGGNVQVETELFKQIKAYNSNLSSVDAYKNDVSNKDYVEAVDAVKNQDPGAPASLVDLRTNYENDIKDNNDEIDVQNQTLKDSAATLNQYKTLDSPELTKDTDLDEYAKSLVEKVNYFNSNYTKNSTTGIYELNANNFSTGANKVNGQDAQIILNGADFTSSTNTFNINGLTIQALAESKEEITITTATDTQGLYDKIKDFISEYNSIINEMSTLYNAPSAKGYEPLTSEEKEALSDSDIAEWEKKVKDSLLRRDSNLSTLMNVMTSAMSATYEVNGKKYSLSSLGIKTGSYFTTTAANRYELHIDGDADDDTVSANADKLMTMLNSDPDTVIGIIQSAASKLSEDLGKQMKSSSLRSFQSIYNDKSMAQSYSDYTKKITAWEEKVTAIEDSYYKKFAAMETALAKLQSQQSAFAGMLGNS